MGDTRGGDEQGHILPRTVPVEIGNREAFRLCAVPCVRAVIPADRIRAARKEGTRRGQARAAKPQDAHLAPFVSADGYHVGLPSSLSSIQMTRSSNGRRGTGTRSYPLAR